MRLVLGPMEGVLDHLMREILTDINDFDLCVTEFVRVSDQVLPDRSFYKLCPELLQGSKTKSGTPVHLQLLGQHPQWMAENAYKAYQLGAAGIDLNFGCPARLVNKSKGGAVLLKEPELMYQIINACREAVPSHIPVTAKIRLGWENPEDCFEIVDAVENAGANELAIHARTKMGGYKADQIRWDYLAKIRQHTKMPLIANGEIWNYEDGQRCLNTTGIDSLMVCRGSFNVPNLGNVVKHNQAIMPWTDVVALLLRYSEYEMKGDKGLYYPNRVKQWFSYLRQQYPEAKELFHHIRRFNTAEPIVEYIHRYHNELLAQA
ncbi:tRNA dihydrouridine synthase DusC [Vibrio sp. UCD-FRSSP16_10]|uniref:tRNA dihydrouridine(16) synthase DusC n=1 Tax=unclassified Vibrio TaxID=2614977 RepID=UPI0007FC85B8|nr:MULTISPECIES: tRNA dihydrouridine(16) synthase DusC [unclassified Vibrio]OBT16050.1 tRNA dihydrouridine synthase DusC [Vibrio sp. UCD-FRSSP16_30]OBT21132.1 tRNA dihydrouridine synthase DusC [Vibrio sp. UCD-FRSSP16_10]